MTPRPAPQEQTPEGPEQPPAQARSPGATPLEPPREDADEEATAPELEHDAGAASASGLPTQPGSMEEPAADTGEDAAGEPPGPEASEEPVEGEADAPPDGPPPDGSDGPPPDGSPPDGPLGHGEATGDHGAGAGDADAVAPPGMLVAARMVTPLAMPSVTDRSRLQRRAKGPKPGMTDFQRSAFRVFGNHFAQRPLDAKLDDALRKSRLGVRAEAVQSAALLSAIIGGVSGGIGAAMFLLVLAPLMGLVLDLPIVLLIGLGPAFAALGGYMGVVATPASRAKARARDIDARLPYALNYIAAMASAGVTVDQIFKSLAEQPIYGEVAKEAEAIYRDMALFGKDAVTAFKRGIQRTPSQRFAELLQGAITTFGSGGDLQLYFTSKAQRYMAENRQIQKQFLETMGLMAETYVTTAVAGPLFLMVMMAIMGMLSGQGPGQLMLVVYMLLPTANFGFVYGLYAMSPKV